MVTRGKDSVNSLIFANKKQDFTTKYNMLKIATINTINTINTNYWKSIICTYCIDCLLLKEKVVFKPPIRMALY